MHTKIIWVLRIAVFGEFFGHGVLALGGKAQWIAWIEQMLRVDTALATNLLLIIGALDVALAIIVLVHPLRPALLWMTFWGFATALMRPLVGESWLDFVERWANWGAPLALYLLLSYPHEDRRDIS